MAVEIRIYQTNDEAAVVQLWLDCGLVVAENDPHKDIQRKRGEHDELFLVALQEGRLVGAVMGGYDGHRGAVNYLAVHPSVQRQGIGRSLLGTLEKQLRQLGCPKINLYVRVTNAQVRNFYEKLGYFENTQAVSFGKRLMDDSVS